MQFTISAPLKKDVVTRYNQLMGNERYSDVKVIKPLFQKESGEWAMIVEPEIAQSFTARGFYG